MIHFSCPTCKALQSAEEFQAGSKYACASCGKLMIVPVPSSAAPEGPLATSSSGSLGIQESVPSPPIKLTEILADVRLVNGRSMIFWPCGNCKIGLNTPYENRGLSIQCPSCQRLVPVPKPSSLDTGSPEAIAGGHPGSVPTYGGKAIAKRMPVRGLIAAAACLLVLAAGVLGLLLWKPWAKKSGEISQHQLKFIPDEAKFVANLDVQSLLTSDVYYKVDRKLAKLSGRGLESLERELKRYSGGIGWTDIQKITVGGTFKQSDMVAVIHLNHSVRGREILSRLPFGIGQVLTEQKVGRFVLYLEKRGVDSWGGCVVDGNRIVLGNANLVRKILERDSVAKMSPGLMGVIKQTDFGKTLAVSLGNLGKEVTPPVDEVLARVSAGLKDFVEKIEGFTLEVDAQENIHVQATILCTDNKTAKKIAKLFNQTVSTFKNIGAMDKEKSDLLESFRFTAHGTKVISTYQMDVDKILRLIENQAKSAR